MMKIKTRLLTLCLTFMVTLTLRAQNVGINSTGGSPAASAGLDVDFSNKGLLIPRVALTGTTDVTTIPSPATSLLVYNTGTGGLAASGYYYYTGAAWTRVAEGNVSVSGWGTTGNPGTNATNNFIGTTDAVDLAFRTANTERMRIASGGNISFSGLGTGSSSDYMMSVNNTTNVIKKIQPTSSSSPFWAIGGNAVATSAKRFGTTTAFDLPIITNNLEKMRITSAGQVGIGTSTFTAGDDAEKVLIDAGTTYNTPLNARGNINDYLQVIVQNQSTGNNASSDFVVANDVGTNYVDFGINSSGYVENKSNILNQINTAYLYASTPQWFYIGHGVSGKGLVFFTNSGNTNANNSADGFPRMEITSDGNIGIGNFVGNGADANNYIITEKLMVDGNITPKSDNNSSSNLGTASLRWKAVYATNGTIQTSDSRLKTNIQPLNYGLKQILSLKPVTYNWKSEVTGSTKVGLIAQDLKQVIPEVVVGDEAKENLGVNYAELIPVLINAIKELKEENNKQDAQINALKAMLNSSTANNIKANFNNE